MLLWWNINADQYFIAKWSLQIDHLRYFWNSPKNRSIIPLKYFHPNIYKWWWNFVSVPVLTRPMPPSGEERLERNIGNHTFCKTPYLFHDAIHGIPLTTGKKFPRCSEICIHFLIVFWSPPEGAETSEGCPNSI